VGIAAHALGCLPISLGTQPIGAATARLAALVGLTGASVRTAVGTATTAVDVELIPADLTVTAVALSALSADSRPGWAIGVRRASGRIDIDAARLQARPGWAIGVRRASGRIYIDAARLQWLAALGDRRYTAYITVRTGLKRRPGQAVPIADLTTCVPRAALLVDPRVARPCVLNPTTATADEPRE
jgi:hypothetical protein